jgi:phage virion morphogenesis protein
MSDTILDISIEIQSKDAEEALGRLRDGLKSPELMDRLGLQVASWSRARILSGRNTAPDGTRWQDLTMATLLRKKKAGKAHKGTLEHYGDLAMYMAHANPTEDSVDIGSTMAYTLIHQFGGKTGKGHKVTIPARPYIGIDQQETEQLMRWVHKWIEGLIDGK